MRFPRGASRPDGDRRVRNCDLLDDKSRERQRAPESHPAHGSTSPQSAAVGIQECTEIESEPFFHAGSHTDATIRRDIAFLSSVFAMAVMWGVVEENRVQRFNKRFLKEARPRTRFLTRGEYRRLIAAASPSLRPLIALAVETGMRKEEMLGLRLSAIDLSRREVHLEDTKNNKPRRVPLADGAVAAIERVLGDPRRPRSSYLFCKPDGSRILCTKKGFAAACRRAGITDFRFHDLRHTFASWWVQNGGDLYKLSRILGHQTLQMSARYGHLRTDDLHEEIERVTRRRRASEEARAI